jgi:hypothetical protein
MRGQHAVKLLCGCFQNDGLWWYALFAFSPRVLPCSPRLCPVHTCASQRDDVAGHSRVGDDLRDGRHRGCARADRAVGLVAELQAGDRDRCETNPRLRRARAARETRVSGAGTSPDTDRRPAAFKELHVYLTVCTHADPCDTRFPRTHLRPPCCPHPCLPFHQNSPAQISHRRF